MRRSISVVAVVTLALLSLAACTIPEHAAGNGDQPGPAAARPAPPVSAMYFMDQAVRIVGDGPRAT